jgi:parvulin-like peptidyl-prolyl isomerase
VLLALALAAVLTGCTTFSDNDAAARVDEVELTDEMLDELVGLVPDPETGAVGEATSADAARRAMTFWLQAQVLEQVLADAGIEVDDATVDEATHQASGQIPTFTELSAETQAFVVDYLATTALLGQLEAPDTDERAAYYEQGPADSGVACVSHILVDTADEARDVLAELEGGADFATLAQERSTDAGSGQQGGVLPCTFTTSFESTYVGPFVEAALAAEVGVPTGPVESEFGYHVILVRPFDDVADEITGYFSSPDYAVADAIDGHDIYVDPRYGTLNDRGVVVALR